VLQRRGSLFGHFSGRALDRPGWLYFSSQSLIGAVKLEKINNTLVSDGRGKMGFAGIDFCRTTVLC
jgi:hypothetical protein